MSTELKYYHRNKERINEKRRLRYKEDKNYRIQSIIRSRKHIRLVTILKKEKGNKCERCGYEWIPRQEQKPKTCASKKCNSPYWDRKKIKN